MSPKTPNVGEAPCALRLARRHPSAFLVLRESTLGPPVESPPCFDSVDFDDSVDILPPPSQVWGGKLE